MVNWEVLCSPHVSGGLGIRSLRDFNILLLSKWWWKLLTNHQSPWVKVILHNYYRHGRPLDLQDKLLGRVSPFWRSALKSTNAFKLGLRISCGKGTSVKFWKDCWLCEIPLAMAFPSPFDIAANKDAWVNLQIHNNNWAISFLHPLPLSEFRCWLCLWVHSKDIQVGILRIN